MEEGSMSLNTALSMISVSIILSTSVMYLVVVVASVEGAAPCRVTLE